MDVLKINSDDDYIWVNNIESSSFLYCKCWKFSIFFIVLHKNIKVYIIS